MSDATQQTPQERIINLTDLAHGMYPGLRLTRVWWDNGVLYGFAEERDGDAGTPASPSPVYGSK